MWFYNAWDGEYDNLVYTALPVGSDNDHVFRLGDLFKVQTNLTSRNILTTSFLGNYLHDQFAFLSPQSPQLSNPRNVSSVFVGSVKDQHYFAGGQLLEAGFAFDQYNLQMTPYGMLPYFANPNTAGGSYYLTDETHARRWQSLANLLLPSHQWHGRHDFKVGVDLDRISYDAQFSRQPISFLGGNNVLTSPDECLTAAQTASFPCTRYSTFGPAPVHWQYNAEVSAYAEDRWSPTNRLLIEPGVRLDWDEIVRQAEVAPRLAGTYVLDQAGNTKISAGIGLVYDATPIYLIARPFAGTRQDLFHSAGFHHLSGELRDHDRSGPDVVQRKPQRIVAPRFVNWSVALEKKLPAVIYLKAEFLEKRGARGFVYDTLNSATGGNFVLQNTRDDHYTALQLTLAPQLPRDLLGDGIVYALERQSNQALDFNVDNPILRAQQPGSLSPGTRPTAFFPGAMCLFSSCRCFIN